MFSEMFSDAIIEVRGLDKGEWMALDNDGISFMEQSATEAEKKTWDEISSISLEDGEELDKRVTLTRIALLGVFAFAAKKKTGGTKYITIEGDGFFWAMEVHRKHVKDAQKFVMRAKSLLAKK